mmetsp:Transcript_7837/g.10755  ORF Transcript_7837/g.10755 Transcript_7837/m.10755 type:complete len:249 (-) Transcript_7837:469-1215(-)
MKSNSTTVCSCLGVIIQRFTITSSLCLTHLLDAICHRFGILGNLTEVYKNANVLKGVVGQFSAHTLVLLDCSFMALERHWLAMSVKSIRKHSVVAHHYLLSDLREKFIRPLAELNLSNELLSKLATVFKVTRIASQVLAVEGGETDISRINSRRALDRGIDLTVAESWCGNFTPEAVSFLRVEVELSVLHNMAFASFSFNFLKLVIKTFSSVSKICVFHPVDRIQITQTCIQVFAINFAGGRAVSSPT